MFGYLLGAILFKRAVGLPWLGSHIVGIALGVITAGIAIPGIAPVNRLSLMWIVTALLAAVVAIEDRLWNRVSASVAQGDQFDSEP